MTHFQPPQVTIYSDSEALIQREKLYDSLSEPIKPSASIVLPVPAFESEEEEYFPFEI